MYELQTRWKLTENVLTYYGLRNAPNLFKNKIKLSKKQCKIVKMLPCDLSSAEVRTLGKLVGEQIVLSEEKKTVPQSL